MLIFATSLFSLFFFFNDTATTEIYTLSLHDALPICSRIVVVRGFGYWCGTVRGCGCVPSVWKKAPSAGPLGDRKSTRLNSSHGYISYAVFCLKKKKNQHTTAYGDTNHV